MSNLSDSSQANSQANFQAALLALTLDRQEARPLHAQLSAALRALILSEHAAPGLRLPPSRLLARELRVSRSTALAALEQLIAEGYLEGRQGAGTFIAANLPADPAGPPARPTGPEPMGPAPARLFHSGVADTETFPHAVWARHLEQSWRKPDPRLLHRPDPFGWPPLRAAIAEHLRAWRGLHCSAGQIIITSGAAEAFGLIAGLLQPGQTVQVESPCFANMLHQLQRAGLTCRPVPVDAQGFDTDQLSPQAAAVVVTPSRQYPLGMTLPLARRLALLDWAETTGGLIVEDDYDSEFRFTGQPLPALASLDQTGRTIYTGSFSKLLSPALRLGYMVVPDRVLEPLATAMARTGPQASLVPQPALARFIGDGGFATHLRRMRRLYSQRQAHMVDTIRRDLGDWLVPQDEPSGMHLICTPGPRLAGVSDQRLSDAAEAAGLLVPALSRYPFADDGRQGIVLGYAAFDEEALSEGLARLRQVVLTLAP